MMSDLKIAYGVKALKAPIMIAAEGKIWDIFLDLFF